MLQNFNEMKIFYDHLIDFDEIEKEIRLVAETEEERHELWHLVDGIIHHKAMGCILHHLPEEHHEEFVNRFHKVPHDDSLLGYLKEKVGHDIEDKIRNDLKELVDEISQSLLD